MNCLKKLFRVIAHPVRRWEEWHKGPKKALVLVLFVAMVLTSVVGMLGTILSTHDSGSTWTAASSVSEFDLNGVAIIDGNDGWAVGDKGAILSTHDGGDTWTAARSNTEHALHGVAFTADGHDGWAVGDSGTILSTHDGGDTWTATFSGIKTPLRGVAFTADGHNGWAVGRDTILTTNDGGATWTLTVDVGIFLQTLGTSPFLEGVAFAADGHDGWTVGDNGAILSTHDGGANWTAARGKESFLNSVLAILESPSALLVLTVLLLLSALVLVYRRAAKISAERQMWRSAAERAQRFAAQLGTAPAASADPGTAASNLDIFESSPAKNLVEACKGSDCVLFAGGGLSIHAGLPSWSEMLSILVNKAQATPDLSSRVGPAKWEDLQTALGAGQFSAVADLLVSRVPRPQLANWIAEMIQLPPTLPPAYQALAKLRFFNVISANWDSLLEKAFQSKQPTVAFPGMFSDLSAILRDEAFCIIELFGIAEQPATILVAAASDT